jgi:hypothetical protein
MTAVEHQASYLQNLEEREGAMVRLERAVGKASLMIEIPSHIFWDRCAKLFVCFDLRGTDPIDCPQNLESEGLRGKILGNKDLDGWFWRE